MTDFDPPLVTPAMQSSLRRLTGQAQWANTAAAIASSVELPPLFSPEQASAITRSVRPVLPEGWDNLTAGLEAFAEAMARIDFEPILDAMTAQMTIVAETWSRISDSLNVDLTGMAEALAALQTRVGYSQYVARSPVTRHLLDDLTPEGAVDGSSVIEESPAVQEEIRGLSDFDRWGISVGVALTVISCFIWGSVVYPELTSIAVEATGYFIALAIAINARLSR